METGRKKAREERGRLSDSERICRIKREREKKKERGKFCERKRERI